MSHINGQIPERNEHLTYLEMEKLEAEKDFYKKLSENFASELRNIPEAITEWGYWQCSTERHGDMELISKSRLESPMKDRAILVDSINTYLSEDGGSESILTDALKEINNK